MSDKWWNNKKTKIHTRAHNNTNDINTILDYSFGRWGYLLCAKCVFTLCLCFYASLFFFIIVILWLASKDRRQTNNGDDNEREA